MKTNLEKVFGDDDVYQFAYHKPLEYPYCGVYCSPTRREYKGIQFNNSELYLTTHFVDYCNKVFFCVYEKLDKQELELRQHRTNRTKMKISMIRYAQGT